jgi:L-iduronidase
LSGRPALANKLFVNSEADSEVGWQSALDFRATPWYSAYTARQIMDAQALVIQGLSVNFRLSNDSAFVGDWKNRTHFAWFGDDTAFLLIKKPSHNVFTLFSFLGGEQYQTSADVKKGVSSAVTAIATARATSQAAVVISNYSGDTNLVGTTSLAVTLKNVPFSSGRLVEYRIDKDHSNSYATWQAMGSPSTFSADELQTLRDKQELERLSLADFGGSGASLNLDLPVSGVSLLLLSADPGKPPSKPRGIARRIYASLIAGREDVAVTWRQDDFTVKTFEVYFSASLQGTFVRVNKPDILSTAFIHQVGKGSAGYYKVRAVDYWDRTSLFSDIVGLDGTVVPSPEDPSDAGADASPSNGGGAGARADGAPGSSSGSTGGAEGGFGGTSNATGGATSGTSDSTDLSSSGGSDGGCACSVPKPIAPRASATVVSLAGLLLRRRKPRPRNHDHR